MQVCAVKSTSCVWMSWVWDRMSSQQKRRYNSGSNKQQDEVKSEDLLMKGAKMPIIDHRPLSHRLRPSWTLDWTFNLQQRAGSRGAL
jgi:hypothetical protein